MSISPVANGRIWIGCTSLLTPSVVSLVACHQYGRGRSSANGDDIRIGTVSKGNLETRLLPLSFPFTIPLPTPG